MNKNSGDCFGEISEFEQMRNRILSGTVKLIYTQYGIAGKDFRNSLYRSLNKHTKTRDFTVEKISNYLYERTPWPDLDRNIFVKSILEAIQETIFEPDDLNREKMLHKARSFLTSAYELSKKFDRVDIGAFFKSLLDTVLQSLNDVTAAVLIKNPEIFGSLTQDDIDFMTLVSSLNKEQQSQEAEAYLNRSVRMSVQDIFKSIGEATFWLNLCQDKEGGVNQPTQKQKKHFERFLEKADANEFTSLLYIATCCINKMIPSAAVLSADNPSGLFLPFDEEEITLLVLFKYCMPMNEKRRVLAELKDMKK